MGSPEKTQKYMFSIIAYSIAIYLVSASVFALELYAIERHEAPTDEEVWVTTSEMESATLPAAPQPQFSETPDVAEVIPDVPRKKRKKLLRRLHKLSN